MSELDRRITKVRGQQTAADARKQATDASFAEYERARRARFAELHAMAKETADRLHGVSFDATLSAYDHNAVKPFWKRNAGLPEIAKGWHVYNHRYTGVHNRAVLLAGSGALYFYNTCSSKVNEDTGYRTVSTEDKPKKWEGENTPFPIDWQNQPFLPDFTTRAPWEEVEEARVSLVMDKLAELVIAKHR